MERLELKGVGSKNSVIGFNEVQCSRLRIEGIAVLG